MKTLLDNGFVHNQNKTHLNIFYKTIEIWEINTKSQRNYAANIRAQQMPEDSWIFQKHWIWVMFSFGNLFNMLASQTYTNTKNILLISISSSNLQMTIKFWLLHSTTSTIPKTKLNVSFRTGITLQNNSKKQKKQ